WDHAGRAPRYCRPPTLRAVRASPRCASACRACALAWVSWWNSPAGWPALRRRGTLSLLGPAWRRLFSFSAQGGKQTFQPVGKDLNSQRGKQQAENTVQDVQPGLSEPPPDPFGRLQVQPYRQ